MDGPPVKGLNYIPQNNKHRRSNESIGLLFILLIVLVICLII
jgi:hypothetical protein